MRCNFARPCSSNGNQVQPTKNYRGTREGRGTSKPFFPPDLPAIDLSVIYTNKGRRSSRSKVESFVSFLSFFLPRARQLHRPEVVGRVDDPVVVAGGQLRLLPDHLHLLPLLPPLGEAVALQHPHHLRHLGPVHRGALCAE
uniref:Uncharacterized protein n=1 Tax=Oryza brachyantha TaxID=4533 RepID=J3LYI5_ORYBR